MGVDRSLRPPTRSRGISDISNFSHKSLMSSNGTNEWEPFRQPRPAPLAPNLRQTSRIQQHEGFVRFLKQHASPPHQRVTAGGRIVPTGPLSPPPMFDYASLNGLVEAKTSKSHALRNGRTNSSFHYPVNTLPASGQTRSSANVSTSQSIQPFGPQMAVNSAVGQGIMKSGGDVYAHQPPINSMVPSTPTQLSLVPLGLFPDGTALITCNGVCYRSYWNGATTIMEPITTGQSVPAMNEPTLNYGPASLGRGLYDCQSNPVMVPPANDQSGSPPSGEYPTVPSFRRSQPTDSTDSSAALVEEKTMKAQLTSLDKHLALHHYEIGPAERMHLVSQRKTFVKAIAKLRSDREPSKQLIPIVAASGLGSRMSSMQPETTTLSLPPTQQPEQGLGRETSLSEHRAFKRLLSPSAPAFVPSSVTAALPDSMLGASTKRDAKATLTKPSTRKAETATDIGIKNVADNNLLREPSSVSQTHAYVEGDPWDPAMKIIPPSMIIYAQKYNTEDIGGDKKFCTTTEEFQEAIRRVREQARMWGCVGGNSKDPAYDAEEDIWYAIKDEYPIPLPAKVPDHITCPRPWNWYDSVFNVNATVKPQMNMRGDTLEDVYPPPKSEATSTKYTFEHTLSPCDKEAKITIDVKSRASNTLTSACPDQLPWNNVPLAVHSGDILDDRRQAQQHKPSMPISEASSRLFGHADSIQTHSTNKKDVAAFPPSSPNYKGDLKQKKYGTYFRRTGGQSSHLASTLHAMKTVDSQSEQGRRTPTRYQVSPSSVAVSAAQLAYSTKTPASNSPRKCQHESSRDRSITARDELLTSTTTDNRSAPGGKIRNNLSPRPIGPTPALSTVQNEVLRDVATFAGAQMRYMLAGGLSAESKGTWGPEQYVATCGSDSSRTNPAE